MRSSPLRHSLENLEIKHMLECKRSNLVQGYRKTNYSEYAAGQNLATSERQRKK